MLPAIARQAIGAYSHPGDLVLDPMCGIGTTLVEAIHLSRDAIGIELEPRWAQLASANITHARRQGGHGDGHGHHR
jgi:DNA modification methylase